MLLLLSISFLSVISILPFAFSYTKPLQTPPVAAVTSWPSENLVVKEKTDRIQRAIETQMRFSLSFAYSCGIFEACLETNIS
uniref:Uncharacterized protein n=1 Tax=Rhizophora mucronata TaxID=61149 RepID=A0A2P2K5T0_RHIMU